MRSSRFIAVALAFVTLAGCARSPGPSVFARNAPPPWQRPAATQQVVMQPQNEAPVSLVAPSPAAEPVYAPPPKRSGPFSIFSRNAPPPWKRPVATQQVVVQQPLEAPVSLAAPMPAPEPIYAPAPVRSGPISIFARSAPPPWRRPTAPVMVAAPVVAAPVMVAPEPLFDAPVQVAYAPSANEGPYRLDSGDKLRVVVFGQDGLSNTYTVDPSGNITMPLIGSVPARGATTGALQQSIAGKLRQGYIREPHVAVEVEAYRPFFILGEVTLPGQYPYVANMTVETAVAIAGGYTPRAFKYKVEISRPIDGTTMRQKVPPNFPVHPGDTIIISERWF